MDAYLNEERDIINYVVSITGTDYIFGNIAFKDNNQVNVGSSLKVGDSISSVETAQLNEQNRIFSDYLKTNKCYSITTFLSKNKLKSFNINFQKKNNLIDCTIILYNYISIKPILELSFEVKNDTIDNSNVDFTKSYLNTEEIPSFTNTLNIYLNFYKIIGRKTGYIYLVRPINIELDFDGLTYMFLSKALSYRDIEIISQKMALFYLQKLKNKVKQESIKSAKAAIMSRNMSHNLGSHYIANTKNYISNLANVKNDKDLRGLTHLLQYIQERMDYIATVISNDVYPLGSLNIKSQIFDELTIDDCGKRHGAAHETTNFLLKYIVFSEKYSRVGNEQSGLKNLRIEINYPDAESDVKVFTGKDGLKDNEKSLKLELSKLNIAAPCGIMARHALFNIVENIIRNSAKHNKGKTSSELVITIRLEKLEENDRSLLKISIYDNMGAYDELIGQNNDGTVAQKLKELRFLDPDGGLNKENKGIKEMIISALWLKNEEVGEVMVEIDSAMEGDAKYKIITEKCLQIESTETKNLAYVISLPIFREVMPISKRLTPNSLKDVFADIIVGEEKQNDQFTKPFNSIFPRYLIANKVEGMSEAEKLKQVIYENLKVNVDDYQICVDNSSESNVYDGIKGVVSHLPDVNELNPNHICFISHFDAKNDSDKKSLLNKYEKFSYMDSISGENFTSTLITPEFLRDPYLKYKVIESALTKIAIIDERIFEKFARSDKAEQHSSRDSITSYVEKNKIKEVTKLLEYINNRYSSNDFVAEKKAIRDRLKQDEAQSNVKLSVDDAIDILCPGDTPQRVLSSRGLYIYSIERSVDSKVVIKDISGTETLLGDKAVLQDVHFLSIHLGLIEKYKTDNDVKTLMSNIERHFGNVKYIAIHSGRGNFSADLSVDLKGYCFVTLSALEAAVNNSKYMLSQLFYNMNYYGKGNINND